MGFGVELHEYVRIAQSRTQPICWFHYQTGFHQQTSKVSRYHEDKSHNGQSSFPNAPLAAAPRPRHGSPRLPRPAARYLSRFVPVARPNPLLGKVKIVQTSNGSWRFAIMEYNGVELVLRRGAEIKDNSGKPIPEFAGWKLELIDNVLAVFSNGKEDACFALPYQ